MLAPDAVFPPLDAATDTTVRSLLPPLGSGRLFLQLRRRVNIAVCGRAVLSDLLMLRVFALAVLCLTAAPVWAQDTDLRLDPIETRADRAEDAPGLVIGVRRQALDALTPDHPAEAINTLPAVNIQMNSGQEHLLAIRSPVLTGGAGQGSFLILENGIPTRSSAFGNVNSLFEPVHEIADFVEVVAGPGSARYGSNAVHGLINFDLPEPAGPSGLHVAGSTLNRFKADGVLGVSQNAFAALSLQTDAGWRDNTGLDQQKLYLASEFQLGGWDALAWLSASNLNQETAGFIRGAKAYRDRDLARTNPNPEAYRDASSARAAIRFGNEMGGWSIRLTPYVRWQEMEFRQHFLPYKGIEENGHSAFGIQTRADRSFEALTWRIGFDADFANGFLKERQDDPFGFFPGDTRFPQGIHYDYEVDTEAYAIWTELDWQASEKLKFLVGLRGEIHNYDYTTDAPVGINGRFNVPADREDDFDLFTPKLGGIYKLSNASELFFNHARGQRAPQVSDLYRVQSQQLPAEAEVETLDSIEIGARGTFGNALTYQIAAYTADKDNFFFRDGDGLNVTDGSTRHTGVDAQGRYLHGDLFAIEGSVSWSDQTYTFDRPANGIADGNRIDTAPEWLADLAFIWAPEATLTWRLEAEYIGEYFTNAANTRDYPGHVVFHAGARYRLSDSLEGYARLRNLFDLEYADRADFAFGSDRYFPGEPLNLTIGIRKTFSQ